MIQYKHKNGFKATLYGKSSMTVESPDGKVRTHTCSRTVNTKEEVMELLGSWPELLKQLEIGFASGFLEDDI